MRRSRIFLLALIVGGLWRLNDYSAWMPLSDYRVEAQSPALEMRLWDVFPSRCLRFWPWLLRDAAGLQEFLERDIPVSMETRMPRLGQFVTTIRWLTPWLKIEWGGRTWCISREGRMWDVERTSPSFTGSIKGPVWRLTHLIPGLDALPDGVFRSPISTDVIASLLEEHRGRAWFDAAQEIVWERRAGMDLFRLELVRGEQRFEVLLQSAKYAGQDIGALLDDVFSKLSKEGGDHMIDATYEGKIVLRPLPDGPKEGSIK